MKKQRQTGPVAHPASHCGSKDGTELSCLFAFLLCLIWPAEQKVVWSSAALGMVMEQDWLNGVTWQNIVFVNSLLFQW